MRRKVIWIMIILVLLGLGGYKFANISKPERTGDDSIPLGVPVEVISAGLTDMEEKLSLTANIAPEAQVTVFSEATGKIEMIRVEEGDKVKEGNLIARIEDKKKTLRVQQTEAGLAAAMVNLENLTKEYERIQTLFEKKTVSQQRKDAIQAQYEAAKAQVEQLKATLGLAQAELEDCTITAPISGIIAKKFIDQGEMIVATSMTKNAPIVTIVNMDTVKVLGGIVERDIGRVKIGQPADVKVDAYPGKVFTGEVTKVSPIVDPQSRSVEVEIMVENKGHKLKPGMFARVDLITSEHKSVLAIPRDCLLGEEGNRYVFVVEDGKVSQKKVELGINQENLIGIVRGLEVGQKVVVSGQHILKDGVRANIIKGG